MSGYIIRAVEKKIGSSRSKMKEAFQFGLGCMVDKGSENVSSSNSEWLDLVDRGGLIHVSQESYQFFHAMEMEVRRYLQDEIGCNQSADAMNQHVCSDIDVIYNWNICQSELEEEERQELLRHVASQYNYNS